MTPPPEHPTEIRLGDVTRALEGLYPPSWAQDRDAVGLVCGDPEAVVRRVLLAIDPVQEVVEEALDLKADLLLVHHPLLLRPVHTVAGTTAKGRVVSALIRGGCALFVAHTNADSAAPGVSDALARVLGLTDLRPLVAVAEEPLEKLVTFVPEGAVDAVVDALAAAGAGRIGSYERCAWTVPGVGTYVPREGARPWVSPEWAAAGVHSAPGEQASVPESRVEMVVPRPLRERTVSALRAAHPYEEPAFDLYEQVGRPAPRGLGRVGRLAVPTTLRAFAHTVADVLPAAPQGVRVAGVLDAEVETVAVCAGSGDSLFDAVRASAADVYVTADLRHHPASEAREEASGGPPYLVDVAHWASEWPWLAGCADRLVASLGPAGSTVETRVSSTRTDPWTLRLPSRGE